jgi:hypothetical protein
MPATLIIIAGKDYLEELGPFKLRARPRVHGLLYPLAVEAHSPGHESRAYPERVSSA